MVLTLELIEVCLILKSKLPAKMLVEMLMKYPHAVTVMKRLQEILQLVNGMLVQKVRLPIDVVMVSTLELIEVCLILKSMPPAKILVEMLMKYPHAVTVMKRLQEILQLVNGMLVQKVRQPTDVVMVSTLELQIEQKS